MGWLQIVRLVKKTRKRRAQSADFFGTEKRFWRAEGVTEIG